MFSLKLPTLSIWNCWKIKNRSMTSFFMWIVKHINCSIMHWNVLSKLNYSIRFSKIQNTIAHWAVTTMNGSNRKISHSGTGKIHENVWSSIFVGIMFFLSSQKILFPQTVVHWLRNWTKSKDWLSKILLKQTINPCRIFCLVQQVQYNLKAYFSIFSWFSTKSIPISQSNPYCYRYWQDANIGLCHWRNCSIDR